MRLPSDSELTKLVDTQASAMDDLCNIYHVSLSSGTYGTNITETLTMVSGVACGIKFTGGRIIERGQTLFVDYDVLLRVPADVSVSTSDEIQLFEKGTFVVSGTFKPYSQPEFNSSVQHVQLKRTNP